MWYWCLSLVVRIPVFVTLGNTRVKSGNSAGKFGHTFANGENRDETGLIRIFTVCLVNLIFIPIIQKGKKQGRCPNLDDCLNLPDFTL